ncbi:MAG: sigma 54-interacting transcriptional regulator [Polyangiales bacterium]
MTRTHSTVRTDTLSIVVGAFHVEVIDGPDKGARATPVEGKLTVGTAEGVTLRLSDRAVSRYHLECEAHPDALVVRDLGSTNGTWAGPFAIREARLGETAEVRVGTTRLRITMEARRASLPLSSQASFGGLLGGSAAMRRIYATLAAAAPTTSTVLITGESGTGKELAARAIHATSERADGPFEVIDCGAMPPTLMESELFGHERGAFTGAAGEREGAFERADGGTLFLDELGELPTELQPKVLRALGEGEVRRIGARKSRKVDVRVVAATNRDLRREVNAGRFRADLYYRLAVIQVRLPPLRERLEDLDVIVPALVARIRAERGARGPLECTEEFLDRLREHVWPGNVRELRNYLEQCMILSAPPPFSEDASREDFSDEDDLVAGLDALPLRDAKAALVERFERRYLAKALEETGGNVAEVARRAGVDRATVFRTLRRIGMRGDER